MRPFCGLCGDPKNSVHGIWLCDHCDTPCRRGQKKCGQCLLASEKSYPNLPEPT